MKKKKTHVKIYSTLTKHQKNKHIANGKKWNILEENAGQTCRIKYKSGWTLLFFVIHVNLLSIDGPNWKYQSAFRENQKTKSLKWTDSEVDEHLVKQSFEIGDIFDWEICQANDLKRLIDCLWLSSSFFINYNQIDLIVCTNLIWMIKISKYLEQFLFQSVANFNHLSRDCIIGSSLIHELIETRDHCYLIILPLVKWERDDK